jgi:hypothetical protein
MTSEQHQIITPTLLKQLREKRQNERYQASASDLIKWLPEVLNYDKLLQGLMGGQTRFDLRFKSVTDHPDGPLDLIRLRSLCQDEVTQFLSQFIDTQFYDWSLAADNSTTVQCLSLVLVEMDGWWHFLLRDLDVPERVKSMASLLLKRFDYFLQKDDVSFSNSALELTITFHGIRCEIEFDGYIIIINTATPEKGREVIKWATNGSDCHAAITRVYKMICKMSKETGS